MVLSTEIGLLISGPELVSTQNHGLETGED